MSSSSRADRAIDASRTLAEREHACPSCGASYPSDYALCPRDGSPLGVVRGERDPLVGGVIGSSYRIERRLADGGMGRLYQASHTRLPRKLAVKVLHEPHAHRPEAVRRFEREASALARLDHPHVLGIIDFVRTADGRGAIVTPLLEGESLEARLARDGRLDPEEALRLAREMCDGVAAAHREGIVHRDLKPSNVFLVERDERDRAAVKLLDFGVAKLSNDDMTRAGVVLGTPAYMAPEQARRSSDVDERADVYAIGAVLYRMLAGSPPYEGDDAASILAQVLAGPARRLGTHGAFSEAIEAIVERAMARDPDERFPSARALARALDDERRSTRPDGADGADGARSPRRPSHAVPRERALTAGVIALAGLVGAACVSAAVLLAARALEAESERALALVFALRLVGSLFGFGLAAWLLGREAWWRRESATSLALARARIQRALRDGVAALGLASLGLHALDVASPEALLGAIGAGWAAALARATFDRRRGR